MLDFYGTHNEDAISKVIEIDKKRHEDGISNDEMTRLMFEQMLRGLYINQPLF